MGNIKIKKMKVFASVAIICMISVVLAQTPKPKPAAPVVKCKNVKHFGYQHLEVQAGAKPEAGSVCVSLKSSCCTAKSLEAVNNGWKDWLSARSSLIWTITSWPKGLAAIYIAQ